MSATLVASASPVLSPYASPEFNASFWQELNYLASDVAVALGDDLIAVVLGGGFGRGEGCVVTIGGKENPYNDVDLFLITRTASPKGQKKLKHLVELYEERLGIAVDFSRPQTPAMIAKWEPLLMWQELLHGHLVLIGPDDVLTSVAPASLREKLPIVEASRMMLNRGAGLLWAAQVCAGVEPLPDSSFVVRNYYKCCQALGDAVLIAQQTYVSDPVEKLSRLNSEHALPGIVQDLQIASCFQKSVAFRRDPSNPGEISLADLKDVAHRWLAAFLWLENRRLGTSFLTTEEYAAWNGRREATERSVLRSFVSNLRRGRVGVRHPREAVYRSLPAALQAFSHAEPTFARLSRLAMQSWREAA